jgi:hypothetical protein
VIFYVDRSSDKHTKCILLMKLEGGIAQVNKGSQKPFKKDDGH